MNDELADYDYPLADVQIAQSPAAERVDSRLLVLERATGRRHHRHFRDLPEFLVPGDLLVLNETRVFPARLFARRRTGGRVEILLLEPLSSGTSWRALGRPAKSLRKDEPLLVDGNRDAAIIPRGRENEQVIIDVVIGERVLPPAEVFSLCEEVGETPLPPYIERERSSAGGENDAGRYQTVYARDMGAVAAPTAGLHFDAPLLEELEARGVSVARITLHVGLGTFQPLTRERLCGETLHSERLLVDAEAGNAIRRAREEKRRIVAVGTTSVRTLESLQEEESFPLQRRTEIFIKPGHVFRSVGALITNFHLPQSSPLVLASAFAGRRLLLEAYAEAIEKDYRFYSYGDAMLIV